jgi:putative flippase GtrA
VNITDLLNREKVLRFLRFAAVGATVAVIDFSSVAIFSGFLPPLIAVTIGYFIAVICHFLLNKYWVFRCRRKDHTKQVFLYGGVILNSWLITIVVVHLCLSTFTSNVLIAKLFAIPCATMWNFLLMQFVVFRAHRPATDAQLDYSSSVGELD